LSASDRGESLLATPEVHDGHAFAHDCSVLCRKQARTQVWEHGGGNGSLQQQQQQQRGGE
jgi:hypothetical protein